MFKKISILLLAMPLVLSVSACSSAQKTEEAPAKTGESEVVSETTKSVEVTESKQEKESTSQEVTPLGTVSANLAEDKDALISTYTDKFSQETYSDSDTGLSITYNLYLPEGYDESKSYPMVVFIADSSCAGNDATRSLSQGRGALVWASEAWQSVNPTIVAVPTYPATILDDHGSYTTTEYVELTKRYIDYMSKNYYVDTNRIYGTGQSMGCMTTLILASKYPDLYAACMFVDGQWDVSTLQGLRDQTFVYFAAEDDERAWSGAQEVMSMLDSSSTSYKYKQWDGNWSVNELSDAASNLFTEDEDRYFISWKSGTIDASNSHMQGSVAYHMVSFDYAYNCVAVMEWLFQQSK